MPINNGQKFDNLDVNKKWYQKWWVVVLIIIFIIISIFLVYFSLIVYNEYQNIRSGGSNLDATVVEFINSRKKVDANSPYLNYSDDPYLGSPAAQIKIIEFIDFQCPYSKNNFLVIGKIAALYGEQIQIVIRDFPLTSIHPIAQKAAEAAGCAQVQSQFWPYHDKLFLNQGNLETEEDLLEFAGELNLNINQFQSCLNSNQREAEVFADYHDGKALGISGTPTLIINGIIIEGSLTEEQLKTIIEYFLTSQTGLNN